MEFSKSVLGHLCIVEGGLHRSGDLFCLADHWRVPGPGAECWLKNEGINDMLCPHGAHSLVGVGHSLCQDFILLFYFFSGAGDQTLGPVHAGH